MTSYAPGSKKGGTTVKVKGEATKKGSGVRGLKKKLKPGAKKKATVTVGPAKKPTPNASKTNKQLKKKIERRTTAGKKAAGATAELKARRKVNRTGSKLAVKAKPVKKGSASGPRKGSGIKKTATRTGGKSRVIGRRIR